jgi:hypothetical protein
MKRSILLLVILLGFNFSEAQNSKSGDGAIIAWEKSTQDFGYIVQGDKVEYTFRFTNAGNKDLVITNVEVTCGCTTPKGWPRDPIPPGEKGELTVAFNSNGKVGKQNKVVTVTSNSEGSVNQVMFSATVLEKKNTDHN